MGLSDTHSSLLQVKSLGPEVLDRFRPLLLQGTTLYASRGLEIFISDDCGESFNRLCGTDLSVLHRWGSRFRILERTARLGFHGLRSLPSGILVGIVRGYIVRRHSSGGEFQPVFRITRGSRPLSLCAHPDGGLFFGEYFWNARRKEVHVFGSDEGRRWEPVHIFPAGSVRHVHGVVYDEYRDGLWVLTGDEDQESGLWFTDDRFDTLEPVLRGTQRARAVSVIPTKRGILVPTDSPRIKNMIQLLELPGRTLTPLCPLPGSALSVVKTTGLYLVSTASEPSSVNDEDGATVYASLGGESWQCIDRLPPDALCQSLPFFQHIARFPGVDLTPGRNETPFVFGYGRAVQGADGRLLRWSRSEIRKKLHASRSAAP